MNCSRLGLAACTWLAKLPLPVLRGRLGRWWACCIWWPPPGARLRCAIWSCAFPRKPLAERKALGQESIVVFCQTFLDRSWLWFGSEALVRSRVQLTGAVHELEGDTPTIVFAPHFYSMDAGGLALPLNTAREFTSIFATNPDPVLDAWFMAGRQRFGKVRMLNRARWRQTHHLSACAKVACCTCCPTWTMAKTIRCFVPFFQVPETATIPSLSRFARLGKAKVVALYNRMTPEGYVAEMTPAWDNFPTDDHMADTSPHEP